MTAISLHHFDALSLAGILAAAAGIWLVWQYRKNTVLSIWRTVTCVLLCLIFLQPEAVKSGNGSKPELAVAVDVSGSMKRTGRLDSSLRALASRRHDLESKYRVRYYAVAEHAVAAGSLDDIAAMKSANGTALALSLDEIRRDAAESLAGILLFTDGNDHGPAATDNLSGSVPITVVTPQARRALTDVAVRSVQIADFAFKNTPVDVRVTLDALGCSGRSVMVSIVRQGATVTVEAQKQVRFTQERQSVESVLSFTPTASGEQHFRVEASPLEGEYSTQNNALTFSLDVVRDKLRVLFLCGQPGPEYAFLRHVLKTDPLVELVSFVILRNPENIALVSDDDLALIPFPVHELFTRDLFDFDVLILQNFTYRKFGFMPEYLANIRRWVMEKGGGLLMSGGANAFGAGGWYETSVADVLPVTAPAKGEGCDESLFKASVSASRHPLSTVSDDEKKSRAFWQDAPELDGIQLMSPKPTAEVIARHPFTETPLITAWEKGKGRAVAVANGTTWRWALSSETPEFYTAFWKNTVRWLANAGADRQLRLSFDRPRYYAGQDCTVRLRCKEALSGQSLSVVVTGPSGKRSVLNPVASGTREWSASFTFTAPGTHRFNARLIRAGVEKAQASASVEVANLNLREDSALDINDTFCAELTAHGGVVLDDAAFSAGNGTFAVKQTAQKVQEEKMPLWESSWLLALACLSLAGEWLFRKMKGIA